MKRLYAVVISLTMLLFVGCKQIDINIEESEITKPNENIQSGYDEFTNYLLDKGLTFTEEIGSGNSILSVEERTILIDNKKIGVYEYNNAEELKVDAEGISLDGSSINIKGEGVCISWVSLPHFFKNDKLIVSYIGKDESILNLLKDMFGDEFAGYNAYIKAEIDD